MSRETVVEYLASISDDPTQQEVVKSAATDLETRAAWVVTAATERGFEFTAEELTEVIETIQAHGDELGDDELESVAGGIGGRRRLGAQGDKPDYLSPAIKKLEWVNY